MSPAPETEWKDQHILYENLFTRFAASQNENDIPPVPEEVRAAAGEKAKDARMLCAAWFCDENKNPKGGFVLCFTDYDRKIEKFKLFYAIDMAQRTRDFWVRQARSSPDHPLWNKVEYFSSNGADSLYKK